MRVVCEVEAEPTVDQAEQEDRGTEVFVHLGVLRRRLGLLPGSVMEEAQAELDENHDQDEEADELVSGGEVLRLGGATC